MTSTDRVTDLAIAGRGYFTLASLDKETGATTTVYTRAGNFAVDQEGKIVDATGNQLQVFPVVEGRVQTKAALTGAVISPEKNPADVRVVLENSAAVGQTVTLNLSGEVVGTKVLTAADVSQGFANFAVQDVNSEGASNLSASYPVTTVRVPLTDLTSPAAGQVVQVSNTTGVLTSKTLTQEDVVRGYVEMDAPVMTTAEVAQLTADYIESGQSTVITSAISGTAALHSAASEYRGVYLQGIGVDSKGMIQATYGDGSKFDIGAIALASFRVDTALKPIGNTKFIASDTSGEAIMTRAGAPYAGDILSGTLEQANVDITQELMTMLKAQQVYNGNARMLQAAVEVSSRITDKI
jgi:flagellar hook protein FlgE